MLGQGVSGRVYLHKEKDLCFVVKKYNKKENYESRAEYKTRVLHEYNLLRKIHHENFIKALRYKVSLDGHTIKVYLEAGEGDLRQFMKSKRSGLSSLEAVCLWKQICIGVKYLHDMGYLHRDLKLENVVLSRGSNTVKIIDLATASSTDKPAYGLVGSVNYTAPEQFTKISYDGKASDMWSLGILLYYLVLKRFPWTLAQLSDPVFVEYIQFYENEDVDINFPKFNDWTLNILSITPQRTLAIDPEKRPDIHGLFEDLWFKCVDHCSKSKECGARHEIREKPLK